VSAPELIGADPIRDCRKGECLRNIQEAYLTTFETSVIQNGLVPPNLVELGFDGRV